MSKYFNKTLKNGLGYLIIQDELINKASFSIDIKVGTFDESKKLAGISHLIEHLVFKGSKNYKNSKIFFKLIDLGQGYYNAKTGFEFTNFRFDVDNEHLLEAIKVFADYVKNPLFKNEDIKTEKQIIETELNKAYKEDSFLEEYFFFKNSNFEAKLKKNHKSLNSSLNKKQLIKFFKKYYVAANMKLVVHTPSSSKKLISFIEEGFSKIRSGKKNIRTYKVIKKNNNIIVNIDNQNLKLYFYLPSLFSYMDTKPHWIINSLINSNAQGSLIFSLREKGLISELWSAVDLFQNFSVLTVDIMLTGDGLKNYKTVMQIFFSYIKFLSSNKIPKYIFEEQIYISKNQYAFQNNSEGANICSYFSRQLFNFKAKKIRQKNELIKRASIKDFQNILKHINFSNYTSILYTKFTQNSLICPPLMEGCKKNNIKISDSKINFHLPNKNKFLPKKIIYFKKDNIKYPHKIIDNSRGYIWFMNDYFLKTPSSYINFDIVAPVVNSSPKNRLLATLYIVVLLEKLKKVSDDAENAGLSFGIERIDRGISIFIFGFSTNILKLANSLIRSLKLKEQDVKNLFLHSYNFLKNSFAALNKMGTYEISKYELYNVLHKFNIHRREYKDLNIDISNLNMFISKVFNRINLEFYIYGNISKNMAISFFENIYKILESKTLVKPIKKDDINVPKYNMTYEIKGKDKTKSISMFIYFGKRSTRLSAIIQIGHIFFKNYLYEQFRNVLKLGYIVETKTDFYENSLGISLSVTSDKLTKRKLVKNIEHILNNFHIHLKKLTEEEFLKTKNSFKKRVLKNNITVNDWMNELVLTSVLNGDINYANSLVAEVDKLGIDELIFSYQNMLIRSTRKSHTVVVF